ncbi:Mini-ribonuclease 3 [Allofustis seminis]|uniref:Mini-ribonuclease 3 n=1 Tax=Allofustis seminis TaxID=166939 RepID=UPI000382F1D6|nr:Mini-ribonuclease 3 [Allofustis seminis]
MNEFDGKLLNGAALAYMGDAIYEVAVRRHLLEQGQTIPNKLHQLATHYVSAFAQAALCQQMQAEHFLTEEEMTYFKRGRNSHTYSKAKNADYATYSQSTGFEAVIGYLELTGQQERLTEVLAWCLTKVDQKLMDPSGLQGEKSCHEKK